MIITLTQGEMELAVRQYMAGTFPALDIDSADVAINDNGEAEIAVVTNSDKPVTLAKPKTAKTNGRSRKKAEPVVEAVEEDTVVETIEASEPVEVVAETISVDEPTEATVPFGLEDTTSSPAKSLFLQ
jgi:hypothetical protein